ncbi:hypothetical protein CSUB01_05172 [Colletotrichum sublineola]|uniref:Uncharacterized protein n=1 Tax=Colletotrichum sublineola TaxID=1173701 RepID=A0A066X873_COLSU|nr:hypothetical protein CSUB01_05172 [Colletotrichum sublineola]
MAVTVEERLRQTQANRMAAIASSYPAASSATTATKRRTASSATIPAKRRKEHNAPRKSRSTSAPSMGRRKSSTPSGAAMLALPVRRTPGAPYARVPTFPRRYLDFSHFLWAMRPDKRNPALKAIEDAGVHGEERWRAQHYDPLYATESCKLAFLIQVEKESKGRSGTGTQGGSASKSGDEELEVREHACYRCYTLQPEAAFEDKPAHVIVSSNGGLRHAHTEDMPVIRKGERLLRRFCIECGVRDGIYPRMAVVSSITGDKWVDRDPAVRPLGAKEYNFCLMRQNPPLGGCSLKP